MDTPPLKTGFATSEFWLHTLTTVGGLVLALLPQNSKWVTLLGGVMALLSSGAYSYIRMNLKSIALDAAAGALKAVSDDLAGNTAGAAVPLTSNTTAAAAGGLVRTPLEQVTGQAPSPKAPAA